MIEKIILDYLTDELTEPVYMEEPEAKPVTFVLIEKTGGGKTNHISSATIAVQSYAPSLYEAAALNERVKAAMENAITMDEIVKVTLNSDYNYTNTASKRYRYQAVFDVIFYD